MKAYKIRRYSYTKKEDNKVCKIFQLESGKSCGFSQGGRKHEEVVYKNKKMHSLCKTYWWFNEKNCIFANYKKGKRQGIKFSFK